MGEAPPPVYDAAREAGPNGAIGMQPTSQMPMNTGSEGKVVALHHLGDTSEWIDCQFCKQRTKTNVIKKGSPMQFVTGALLCLVCICLAPLPCMLHWFEETQWFCTSCKSMVAMQRHDAPIQVNAAPEQKHVQSQYPQVPEPSHAQVPHN
ncbi:hypothetical protein HJFPF1_02036 [Paramyrothecium foliicola]|nr:hypothetical protein HJFPF1_02036 [Paramyrothecium foliicola]